MRLICSIVCPLFTGKPIKWYNRLDSTNRFAAVHIKNGQATPGIVYAAKNQYEGRGQRDNVWEAEPGQNLTFSVVYEPDFLAATGQFYLNMVVCLAITRFLKQELGIPAKVKWPNDIYVEYDKIAGVLIENSLRGQNISHSIIGIGLNVNQVVFSDGLNATSVKLITGQENELEPLLEKFVEYLEPEYLLLKAGRFTDLYERYIENLLFYNTERLYSANGSLFKGTIQGINPDGKLVVASPNGTKEFGFKEIEFMI